MAENRKARAQSRKLATLEGESERGNAKDMADRLRRGCAGVRDQGSPHRTGDLARIVPWARNDPCRQRPRWPVAASRAASCSKKGRPSEVRLLAAGQRHRALDRAQVGEGIVREALGIDGRFVLSPAAQPHELAVTTVLRGHELEPTLDVGGQGGRIEHAEGRFGAEVGQGVRPRGKGLPAFQGPQGQGIVRMRRPPGGSSEGNTTGSKQ